MVAALVWLFLVYGALNLVHAEEPGGETMVIEEVYQSEPVTPHVFNGDLRDLSQVQAWRAGEPIIEIPKRTYPDRGGLLPEEISPLSKLPLRNPLLELQEKIRQSIEDRTFSTPDLNFEGTPFTGVTPPDTVGEVGAKHYIQLVNGARGSVFRIHDKAGSLLAGPSQLNSLWTAGGPCASGLGDPIVLYDELADRWLMSEFASSGNHLCVYISQTPDPVSGGWFLYDFTTPNFPDYPKYAVWPDAYYVSTNESNPAVYALDRNQMLNGLPATFQRFVGPDLAAFPLQAFIPSDLDGSTPPPAGSPNFFMRHRDDEAHNPGSNDPSRDFLEIWEFHVDFTYPPNSTFTGPTNIPVTEFDSELCEFDSSASLVCFPQSGTAKTLDPLREVIMWRLQYRNFGTHETLVGNLVTDVDGTDHGGIRWFELRKTGSGSFTLFQEGTYAPDTAHRWMGSIAMDKDGNIALGYSISSPELNIFPSIRYVGRLASDPAGTLPQGEFTLIAGTAPQTFSTRWGDYSSMNVDPADGCTFWYTNEYIDADGLWNTRVGSFKFESCGIPSITCSGLTATIVGTPGNDHIDGTAGLDVIHGLGGSDFIRGFRGDDIICGGDGRDIIKGDGGKDLLLGQDGNDTINGGIGKDELKGMAGNDTLNGRHGNDRLLGGRGNDTLNGNRGDDRLDGVDGTDICNGGLEIDTAVRCETVINVP